MLLKWGWIFFLLLPPSPPGLFFASAKSENFRSSCLTHVEATKALPELSALGLCLEEELRDIIMYIPEGDSVSYFPLYLHLDLSPFVPLSLSRGFGGWSLLASFTV